MWSLWTQGGGGRRLVITGQKSWLLLFLTAPPCVRVHVLCVCVRWGRHGVPRYSLVRVEGWCAWGWPTDLSVVSGGSRAVVTQMFSAAPSWSWAEDSQLLLCIFHLCLLKSQGRRLLQLQVWDVRQKKAQGSHHCDPELPSGLPASLLLRSFSYL